MSDDDFETFAEIVGESWEGMTLEKPRIIDYVSKEIEMNYMEERIPREVYWSGFGFQVWMQTMLQFMRGGEKSLLVLDEPDIYLHPDAQKALIKIVQERFTQFFVATHSTEIVNEVEPGDILLVTRDRNSAQRISSEDGYRELFNYLGSSENAEFSRIARARRIVFFEGKDRKIIRRIASKIDNTEMVESPDTAYFQAGGFSQWSRIQNVDWTLENMFKIDAKIASIFDRDYRCDEEIEEFLSRMSSERMSCHVLDRKEIENYAIELEPLKRLIIKRVRDRGTELSLGKAEAIIYSVCGTLKADVQAQRTASYLAYHKPRNPGIDDSTHLKNANALFNESWGNFDGQKHIIPGKLFFSELSKTLQSNYRVGITIAQAIGEMRRNEVSNYIANVLSEIESFFVS
ncbi:MAG: AAA family ATPase [Rhodobacter sp.]|nr:AAA family ATPase [Rhodobacter sp.]